MKIGAVSLGWGKTPLPTVCQQLSAMGGECIEINGRPGLHDGLVLDDDTIPQVQAWAQEAGLEISGLSGYCDFAQTSQAAIEAEIELILSSCRIAAKMGLKMVRAFVANPKPETGKSYDDFHPQIVTAFKTVAQEAGQLGITLGLENHGHLINDGPMLARLVEDIGASNIGITLDTGNFCGVGHSLEQHRRDVAAVLPYVVNVHIKDGVWQGDKFEFVTAGEGVLNLAETMDALSKQGYQGAVCSEYEGAGDFLSCTRQSIAYLKSLRS